MITGAVVADEPRIPLMVRGSGAQEQEIEAIIDTGFTGWQTLPPVLVCALGLRWQSLDRGTAAAANDRLPPGS
jgi:predicted aspartyl protease